MIIENVIIEDKVKEKILDKHNITAFEIRNEWQIKLFKQKKE